MQIPAIWLSCIYVVVFCILKARNILLIFIIRWCNESANRCRQTAGEVYSGPVLESGSDYLNAYW